MSSTLAGLLPAIAAACFGLVLPTCQGLVYPHYERPPCQGDEVEGEVLGLSGYVCSPRCAEGTYDCPSDVPDLAAARPQCTLKDADQGAFCALLCTVDSQCPTSARCNRLQQADIGLCMYPLSFSDWARQSNVRKLSFGLPQRSDRKVPLGVAQKAVQAVQNLKSKYGIQDGDADVVVVKEFLAVLTGAAPPSGASASTATIGALGNLGSMPVATMPSATIPGATPVASSIASSFPAVPPAAAISATVTVAPPQQPAALPNFHFGNPSEAQKVMNAYSHDLTYHTDNLRAGIPGLAKEVTDAMYEAEHITQSHAASDLLRHMMEIFLVYLIIGVIYKNQAHGATGLDMIPHIGFWMEYPKLVQDGMNYSMGVAGEYLGMDAGPRTYAGGGFESLGRGERDTFAQFEPSK